jgi:hypothetical protein
MGLTGNVSDPDPAFRLNTDPDPIRKQGFMVENWKIFCS